MQIDCHQDRKGFPSFDTFLPLDIAVDVVFSALFILLCGEIKTSSASHHIPHFVLSSNGR
jgi:hypothetical protein